MKRVVVLFAALALLPAGGAQAAHAPNDPYYSKQWGLKRIDAAAAWHRSEGKDVIVAVLDTGVSPHEDLPTRMTGWDAINNRSGANDVDIHGTHVAGIIAAARNNGRGIAGVAPKAKVLPVRVCEPNHCPAAWAGLIWAADHGAQVINMSLGPEMMAGAVLGAADPFEVYAAARGAVVVASAGNEGEPVCGHPGLTTICVGALDKVGGLAGFSNYGAAIDVVAPGVDIVSTIPWGYGSLSGTSMAAPFVSGVAALLIEMGATNVQAASIIMATAEDRGLPGYDHTYGWGVVDAKAAVDLCAQICP